MSDHLHLLKLQIFK